MTFRVLTAVFLAGYGRSVSKGRFLKKRDPAIPAPTKTRREIPADGRRLKLRPAGNGDTS